MLTAIIAALATGASPPSPPPNPCTPKESCRYVESIALVRPGRVDQLKADFWAPYVEDGKLRVFLGETIVVRLVDDGKGGKAPVVLSSGRARDLPHGAGDKAAERKFTTMQTTDKQERLGVITSKDGPGPALKQDRDTLRFTLYQPEGGSVVVLRVDNGYDGRLTYRAAMSWGDGQDRPTNVCPVRAVPNYETWGDPIVSMRLSGFELAAPSDVRATLEECQ